MPSNVLVGLNLKGSRLTRPAMAADTDESVSRQLCSLHPRRLSLGARING